MEIQKLERINTINKKVQWISSNALLITAGNNKYNFKELNPFLHIQNEVMGSLAGSLDFNNASCQGGVGRDTIFEQCPLHLKKNLTNHGEKNTFYYKK